MTGFLTGPATTTDLLRLKPRETPLRGGSDLGGIACSGEPREIPMTMRGR